MQYSSLIKPARETLDKPEEDQKKYKRERESTKEWNEGVLQAWALSKDEISLASWSF